MALKHADIKGKKILVTSALPYANGSIHIGHLVEYIQTDIFVRFLKLLGEDACYICADDTHGTPIEIAAQKKGVTPEELIAHYHKEHLEDFSAYHINFDSYYSTNSDENKHYSDEIFLALQKKGLIHQKDVELTYCDNCARFLPDRYVKGICPKCGAEDQYGDVCEKCGATHDTTDLIDPYCTLCKSEPSRKVSKHYYFKLGDCADDLKKWITGHPHLQPEVTNYLLNWIKDGLTDWCISRDAPYFGFKVPGEEDKYYYVWLDAPIGYIASTANYCRIRGGGLDTEKDYWKNDDAYIIHVIGKDISYFHLLFWPAELMHSGFSLPKDIVVHGFLTVNGEKMSKSRGTFLTAREFLDMGDPSYLRFYFAGHLSKKMQDINLDFEEYKELTNNRLIASLANFCFRVLSFLKKNYDGKVSGIDEGAGLVEEFGRKVELVKNAYLNFNFKVAVKEIMAISDLGNQYFQEKEPWKTFKEDKEGAHKVLGTCVNLVRNLGVLISPILPEFGEGIRKQLGLSVEEFSWDSLGFALKDGEIGNPEIIFRKIEKDIVLDVTEAVSDVKYTVTKEVADLGVKVRVARLTNLHIKKKHEGIEKLKKKLKEDFGEFEDKELLAEYNHIDSVTGVDSEKDPNSVINLFNLLREKGQIPQINTAVDVYNIASVKHGISMATHDISKLDGSVVVRLSDGGEKFLGLGRSVEELKKGEVVYSDDKKVIGRFSKQCKQTQTSPNSKHLLLVAFGNSKISDAAMDKAMKETCDLLVKYNGGEWKILKEGVVEKGFSGSGSSSGGSGEKDGAGNVSAGEKGKNEGNEGKESGVNKGAKSGGGDGSTGESDGDDVFPMDLKVGKIVEIEEVPDSAKLYKLQVDLGSERRQVIAGIKEFYTPEQLTDRNIVLITNLKKAKLAGLASEAMLLGAGDYHLLSCPNSKPGDQVYFEGIQWRTGRIRTKHLEGIELPIFGGRVVFKEKHLKTDTEEVSCDAPDGSVVH